MPREYTNDGGLGDFIVGQATGAGYNFHSRLGAQYQTPQAPVPVYSPQGKSNNAGVVPGIATPVRQLTPEELAELARRNANQRAISGKAPLFKRAFGYVRSYLDTDGDMIVNADGDLGTGQVVVRSEHLRRLKLAYQRFWEIRLEVGEEKKESSEIAAHLYRDAGERLKLLKSGIFLVPVNANTMKLQRDLFRRDQTRGASRIVKNQVWRVRINAYDQRFRKFVYNAYCGAAYASVRLGDRPLASLPGKDIFDYFLKRPYTITTMNANRRSMAKNAPLLKWFSGQVVSYLDAEGRLILNSQGNLDDGQLVTRSEHLRRLAEAYRTFWEARLEDCEASKDDDDGAAKLHRDARERLKQLKLGKFLTPVSRNAMKLERDLFQRKKTLFGSKVVKNRIWRVRIAEYDRRFRKFVDFVYDNRADYAKVRLGDRPLSSLPVQEIFEYYLKRPYTITS